MLSNADTVFENNTIYVEGDTQIKLKKVKDVFFINNKISKPIKSLNTEDNILMNNKTFNLEEVTRQALDKLKEIKNNAQK